MSRSLLKTLVITSSPDPFKNQNWLDVATTYQEATDLIIRNSYSLICADAVLTTENAGAYRIFRFIKKNKIDVPFYEMRQKLSRNDSVMNYGLTGVIRNSFSDVKSIASGLVTVKTKTIRADADLLSRAIKDSLSYIYHKARSQRNG